MGTAALLGAAEAVPLLNFRLLDFEHYLSAARLIWSRASPYGVVEFFAPPWMAVLMAPFLWLSPHAAKLIWLLLNLTAVAGAALVSFRWTTPSPSPRWKFVSLLALALVAFMPAALFSYVTGQVSPLVGLALLLLAWHIAAKPMATEVILVSFLVTTLKPHLAAMPVALCLLELLRRRDWKLLAWLALGVMAATLFAYATNWNWLSELLLAWQSGDYRGGRSGLVAAGYTGLSELGIPAWLWLPLATYVVVRWWRHGLTSSTLALALAVNLLLLPYSRSYDYVLLILPGWSLGMDFGRRNWLALGIAVVSLFVLPFTVLGLLTPVLIVLGLLWQARGTNPRH